MSSDTNSWNAFASEPWESEDGFQALRCHLDKQPQTELLTVIVPEQSVFPGEIQNIKTQDRFIIHDLKTGEVRFIHVVVDMSSTFQEFTIRHSEKPITDNRTWTAELINHIKSRNQVHNFNRLY
uniref:Transposase n=1 Tax=Caenorhabditis tropicalis TaxID=1561998 RepID=A0A1I7UPV0_9PELO